LTPRYEEEEPESTSDLNQSTYTNANPKAPSNMDVQLYSNETQSWDIDGHYKITKVETHGKGMDTSDFSLKIFYSKASDKIRQVYATFNFDSLDGIMRLPQHGKPDMLSQGV
jgi:hypothetical protein